MKLYTFFNFLKKEWFPFFTLVTAVIALMLSIMDRRTNEKHYEATMQAVIQHDKFSVAPLIDFRYDALYNNVELYLVNVGEGPATVLSVEFYYQGNHFAGVREFELYLMQREPFYNRNNDSTRYGGSWVPEDRMNLGVGAKLSLLSIDHAPFEDQLRLSRILDSTGTKVTYLDLYQDTFQRVYKKAIILATGEN